MTNFIDEVIAKAKQAGKTIVLPEGDDERVLEAAHMLTEEKIVKVILLGDETAIKNVNCAKRKASAVKMP